MRFDTSATTNPIDQLKVAGHPVDRFEGKLKTTGTATYEYHDIAGDVAFGYILGAGIARGRITWIDTRKPRLLPAS